MPDKVVDIPGVGNVSFPDSMTDDDINKASVKLYQSSASSEAGRQNVSFPLLGASSSPQFAGTQAGTKTFGVGSDDLLNRQSVPVKDSGDIMKELAGRASNAIGMGSAGAQLGSPGGLPGMLAGGIGGGIVGGMLPPSDTPLMDTGVNAADLLASYMTKGLSNTGRGLIKAATTLGGTGLGALVGSQGDKALGFQRDTPWDKIGIFSGISSLRAMGSAMAAEKSTLAQAADRLQQQTANLSGGPGVQYPLSFSEQTGRGGFLEKMFATGSGASKTLGVAQDAAAQSALEKITGVPLSDSIGVILDGTKVKDTVRNQVIKPWLTAWQDANPVVKTSEVPTGVLDASGNPVTKTVTTTSRNLHPDWSQFDRIYNLTKDERDGLFRVLHTDPDKVISSLIPTRENQIQGLYKLRGLIKTLETSGNDVQAGQLGAAFTTRLLRGPMENGEAASGAEISRRINNAIGTPENPGHLLVALGPERTEALKTLGDIVKDANPLDRVADRGISAQERAGGYTFNKTFFRMAEAGALAGASGTGAAHGDMGTIFLGTVGGAVVGMTFATALGAVMMQPRLAKAFLAASKGDASATARIVRTLTSSVKSDNDKPKEEAPSIKSRLEGLFQK